MRLEYVCLFVCMFVCLSVLSLCVRLCYFTLIVYTFRLQRTQQRSFTKDDYYYYHYQERNIMGDDVLSCIIAMAVFFIL